MSSENQLICSVLPIADGGEGSLDAIQGKGNDFTIIEKTVLDPLSRSHQAYYLIDPHTNTAYIELSIASGIERLKHTERNCWETTAFGTGELIQDAISKKVSKVYLFLGSSSTTEMGISLASACGWKFYNKSGLIEVPTGEDLLEVVDIVKPDMTDWPEFIACADVDNPLYGPKGAAYVYGPQKGANADQIKSLDQGLKHVSELVKDKFLVDIQSVQGAGAAGGIGGGLQAFFNASVTPGFKLISEVIGLEEQVKKSDAVITGEGSFDEQSLNGKGVHRIIQLAMENDKKSIVICGRCGLGEKHRSELGDCTIYDLSAIFKHQEISKENTLDQIEQLKNQIITSLTS